MDALKKVQAAATIVEGAKARAIRAQARAEEAEKTALAILREIEEQFGSLELLEKEVLEEAENLEWLSIQAQKADKELAEAVSNLV